MELVLKWLLYYNKNGNMIVKAEFEQESIPVACHKFVLRWPPPDVSTGV